MMFKTVPLVAALCFLSHVAAQDDGVDLQPSQSAAIAGAFSSVIVGLASNAAFGSLIEEIATYVPEDVGNPIPYPTAIEAGLFTAPISLAELPYETALPASYRSQVDALATSVWGGFHAAITSIVPASVLSPSTSNSAMITGLPVASIASVVPSMMTSRAGTATSGHANNMASNAAASSPSSTPNAAVPTACVKVAGAAVGALGLAAFIL